MLLRSLKGCRLIIGSYPPFDYDATGGGGKARVYHSKKNNTLKIIFSSKSFSIPPLNSRNTKFLAIPLPPGIEIVIKMYKLEGTINTDSGEIILTFESRFRLKIISLLSFPDLFVNTKLTTRKVRSSIYKSEGSPLQGNGETTLVGISIIPKTNNAILNTFLSLPNEALAVLKCKLT
tara:strand:- start:942 stop:1472 length:531 start_codon:yes stop_codon:yes gene_type:complete